MKSTYSNCHFASLCFKNKTSQMGSIIVYTLSKTFTKVVTYSGVRAVRSQPIDFRFNADPVALKLVAHNNTIVFRDGTGSCLIRLKCKRNARYVAVTDSFLLINVSTMKVLCSPAQQFMAANEKNVQFMAVKETKNNGIIKKQTKMALYEKMALLCTFLM